MADMEFLEANGAFNERGETGEGRGEVAGGTPSFREFNEWGGGRVFGE